MKLLSITISLIISSIVFSQKISGVFDVLNFQVNDTTTIFETNLEIEGNSINYISGKNDTIQGAVSLTYYLKQQNEIINFKKIDLHSPKCIKGQVPANFIDVQRFTGKEGQYTIELELKDKNKDDSVLTITKTLDILINPEVKISTIQKLASFTETDNDELINAKSGFLLTPKISNYYTKQKPVLDFYAEIYNTHNMGQKTGFILEVFVEEPQTFTPIESTHRKYKMDNAPIIPILKSVPLNQVPSGNYNLTIQVRDQKNEFVAENKIFFQYSNPGFMIPREEITFISGYTQEELTEFIHSLQPIATIQENKYISKCDNAVLSDLQDFFISFWLAKDSINPSRAWSKYHKDMQAVEQNYGTPIIRGYQTDRGRVYLKYGKPNTIVERKNEPSSYPHEIWHYYKLENTSNVKFVFYNTNQSTNNYTLLHSNYVKENSNPQWKVQLHKRTHQPTDINETQHDQHWGNQSDDFYSMPR